MLSLASCLTFILPHFHWICLCLSLSTSKGLIYCVFCKPWIWTSRPSLQLCFAHLSCGSGGKNMHSVLVQHRGEHRPSSTFTQINCHISFQSVPGLSVIYNIQLLWGRQSHIAQTFVPEQTFTLPGQRPSLEVLDSGCHSWDTLPIWDQLWHQKSLSSSPRAGGSAGSWEHTNPSDLLLHFKIWWSPSEDTDVTNQEHMRTWWYCSACPPPNPPDPPKNPTNKQRLIIWQLIEKRHHQDWWCCGELHSLGLG